MTAFRSHAGGCAVCQGFSCYIQPGAPTRGADMSTLMKLVGGLWALLGAYTVVSILRGVERGADGAQVSDVESGAVILAFVLMILPGLVVYGLGARITKTKVIEARLRACPFCAE